MFFNDFHNIILLFFHHDFRRPTIPPLSRSGLLECGCLSLPPFAVDLICFDSYSANGDVIDARPLSL